MAEENSQLRKFLSQYGAWLALASVILFVVFVRVRLREMPLERDEGEYAYAGQLILQGVPPYQLAYNMKLPGTYAAYSLIMAVFGQTASGIHLGLTLVNVATILLVFLLGRKLLDSTAGAVSAVTYGLLSTSPAFLGLAAHATHFVVFCALVGAWLLLRACETGRGKLYFLSGVMFGLAYLMKQHGLFFGIFGLGYVVWRNSETGRIIGGKCFYEAGLLVAGLVLPFGLTCLALAAAGVFQPFIFWTFTYARQYVGAVGFNQLPVILQGAIQATVGLDVVFWILSAVGVLMMWWEKRLRSGLPFMFGLLLAGLLALCSGMYFRHHYFILLLPAVALLNGVVVSRAVFLIRHEKSVELFLALAALVLFGLAVLVAAVMHGDVWFAADPAQASRRIYQTSLFCEAESLAADIQARSPKNARIVVLGSEPQIYFYARRRSATGYIYTYPLMERHLHAARMQEEMIREIEQAKPDYLVYVDDSFSWLTREASERKIFNWWQGYWGAHYDLVRTVNITKPPPTEVDAEGRPTGAQPEVTGSLMLLKRKDASPTETANPK